MKTINFPYGKLLLVLCCLSYIIHCQIIPELMVERTTHIVFPGDQIDRLFQCLCESTSLTCTIWYSKNGTDIYNVIDTNQTETTNIVISSRNFKTYTCSLSENELWTRGTSSCIRTQGPDDCVISTNSFCRSCDIGFALIFWEFENNAIVHNWNGLVKNDVPTTTTQTATAKTAASVAPADDEDDDLLFFIIIGVLSAVVFILLITVIVLVVLLRHRPKPQKSDKKPKADLSPLIDANKAGFSTNSVPHNAQELTNDVYVAHEEKNESTKGPMNVSYINIKQPELSVGRTAELGESRGINEKIVQGSANETYIAPVLKGQSSSGYANTIEPSSAVCRTETDRPEENMINGKVYFPNVAPGEKDERSHQLQCVNEACAHAKEPETIPGGSSGIEQKMANNDAINNNSNFAKKFSTAPHQTDFKENSTPAQTVDISNLKEGSQNGAFLVTDKIENSKTNYVADYSTATYL